jgi:hypothetical protein
MFVILRLHDLGWNLLEIVCFFQLFTRFTGIPIVHSVIVLQLDLGDLHLTVEAYDNTLTVHSG